MKKQLILFNAIGVLLLEVLLATIILGVGLTAVIRAFSMGLEGYQRSQEYQNAAALLENKLAELLSYRYFDPDRERKGLFDEPFQQYRYEVLDNEVDDSDVLRQVQVVVFWPARRGERFLQATTYMLINPKERS